LITKLANYKVYLSSQQTSLRQELLAGFTTFFTMAYITIVAPNMYAASGMNFESSFLAVCLVTSLATLIVGVWSNLPIGVAPGLGLLSYFCFVVIGKLDYSWELALGAVFLSGLIFLAITITRIRQYIISAIPQSLGLAITAGIGFFIGFIALKNVGVIIEDQATLVSMGHLAHLQIILFFLGFLLIAVLDGHNIKGAMLISILVVSVLGNVLGLNHFEGFFAWPHFDFSNWGAFEVKPLLTLNAFSVLFTFVIIALFDSTGSLLGITKLIHFKNPKLEARSVSKALFAESFATIGASFVGASTLSPYIESAAGIKAGGRTGLTAVIIAVCFISMLFFAPLAKGIPPFATAGALFYVACLMMKPFADVAWDEPTELIPAIVTLLIIPLSFSIADGVGLGIISYVILKVAHQKVKDIHPMMWVLAFVFLLYFSL
jgi:AGZA family xanthine/uracil permease-like MFS transporter